MSIVTLTSDGLDIACVKFLHDWSVKLSINYRFPGELTSGLSGREERRPGDEALRLTAGVRLSLEPAEADALRQFFATVGKGWIGIPLWNDVMTGAEWAAGQAIHAPQRLLDLTGDVIVEASAGLEPENLYAPLLVGHIDELPTLELFDDTRADVAFTLFEDSPWAFRIGINSAGTAGLWPSALVPDWTSPPRDVPAHGLTFAPLGEGRERTIDGEERAFRWSQDAEFWLNGRGEVRTLLAFFLASQGQRQPFVAPWWFKPGTATAETPHSTTVRFAADSLALDYFTDADATVRVGVTQLPWEIAGVDGEVPVQPSRIFLYKLTYALPAPVTYRFTNCWRPLTRAADGTYEPRPFKHRELTGTLDLKGNQISIDSFLFASNPLALFHPNIREGRLYLTIYEIETDPINADSATVKWFGEIRSARVTGRKVDAAGVFVGQILNRQLPNVLIGPRCNTRLFSPKCGLDRATFLRTGTFDVSSGLTIDVTTAATDAANTFAHGEIEIGTGAAWEVRTILTSAPISGGQRFTIDWPVRQAAAGQDVAFVRGCDLSAATCTALGNFERFRGHPNRPTTNFSLPAMQTAGAPGKK